MCLLEQSAAVYKYLTEHEGFCMWLSAGHPMYIDLLQHLPCQDSQLTAPTD